MEMQQEVLQESADLKAKVQEQAKQISQISQLQALLAELAAQKEANRLLALSVWKRPVPRRSLPDDAMVGPGSIALFISLLPCLTKLLLKEGLLLRTTNAND